MQEGEEVAVTVRFIVNFNGDLVSFDVMETGGESFDNEVIRVLKKDAQMDSGKNQWRESFSIFYDTC